MQKACFDKKITVCTLPGKVLEIPQKFRKMF